MQDTQIDVGNLPLTAQDLIDEQDDQELKAQAELADFSRQAD